jgi:hypothetical protein
MCNPLLDPRKYWVLEQARRPQLTQNVTLVNDVGDPRICKSLKRWRPRRDLNPRLRRESALFSWRYKNLESAGGAVHASTTPVGAIGTAYRYIIVT